MVIIKLCGRAGWLKLDRFASALILSSLSFLKWTLSSLYLDMSTDAKSKIENRMAISVDPDEPSHLDLHCLHK